MSKILLYQQADNPFGIPVLHLETDRIDASNADMISSLISSELRGKAKVVIDLSLVDFIDSSGIGALIQSLGLMRDAHPAWRRAGSSGTSTFGDAGIEIDGHGANGSNLRADPGRT